MHAPTLLRSCLAALMLIGIVSCGQQAPSHDALDEAASALTVSSPDITDARLVSLDTTPLASGELSWSVIAAEGIDDLARAEAAADAARLLWDDPEGWPVIVSLEVLVFDGATHRIGPDGTERRDGTSGPLDQLPMQLPEALTVLGLPVPEELLDASGRTGLGRCELFVAFGPRPGPEDGSEGCED